MTGLWKARTSRSSTGYCLFTRGQQRVVHTNSKLSLRECCWCYGNWRQATGDKLFISSTTDIHHHKLDLCFILKQWWWNILSFALCHVRLLPRLHLLVNIPDLCKGDSMIKIVCPSHLMDLVDFQRALEIYFTDLVSNFFLCFVEYGDWMALFSVLISDDTNPIQERTLFIHYFPLSKFMQLIS